MADKLLEFYYYDHDDQLQKLNVYAKQMEPLVVAGHDEITTITTSSLRFHYDTTANHWCQWEQIDDELFYVSRTGSSSQWVRCSRIGRPGGYSQPIVDAFRTRLAEYSDFIKQADPDLEQFRNVIKLKSASDRSKMFYESGTFDTDPPSNPYIGQELTYITDDGVTCHANLALFVRDEMRGGVLTPVGYVSGLYGFDPPGQIIGSNGNQYLDTSHAYSAEDQPAVGFWHTTVYCDQDAPMHPGTAFGGDGDLYDTSYAAIVMIIRNGSDNTVLAVIPERIFHAIDAGEPTTDSPEGTNVTPTGWTGNWDFTSDHDQPKATTGYGWANLWTHGLRLYSLTSAEVGVFLEEMWNFSILKMLKQKWSELTKGDNFDWLRGIITLHILPCTVGAGEEKTITIFGQKIGNAKGHLITKDHNFQHVVTVESNDLKIPHTIDENVFLDYDGCSAYLMLPFIGQISIDVKRFRGGHIKVEYKIDILTGNCIARVYAASKKLPGQFADDSGKQILIYQGTGNCSIPIPYCGNTEGGFKQLGAIAGIGMAAAGIVTGTAPLTMAGAAGAVSELTQAPQNTERHSYTASEGSGLMYPDVKLVIEGPFPQIPERQRIDYGYAAFQTAKISSFRDYPGKQPGQKEFLQGKVHADITGATAAEKAEIERLFERGVMI